MTAPSWEDALCREVGLELFFPEKGDPWGSRAAKRLCNGDPGHEPCPVKDQCLEWALEVDDRHAILGGTTPRQRHKMRSATPGHPCRVCGKTFEAPANYLDCSDECRLVSQRRRNRKCRAS